MKKLFTLVAMALMAIGANAQTKIAEVDFTTATEFTGWTQFADEQTDGKVELTAEGLAITVGIQTGQLWQPQIMVIPDGSFDLAEDGNYKVVVTAKFPADGTLQINMGTWSANDQATFDIKSTGDFQEVECEFEPWAGNMEGSHLLFQPGDFKGTTIVKKVEVYDMDGGSVEPAPEPAPAPAAGGVLAEVDFTTLTEFNGWVQFADEQTDGKVELTADGLAITVGIQTGQLWQPQIMVIPDGSFDLAEDGNYKVVLTAKFPTDGTLQINMGTWSANDQSTFDIASTGDFQEVECVFEPWAGNMEGSHLLFQPGDFKGTTILKSIKVISLDGDNPEPEPEPEPQPAPEPAGDTVLAEVDFTTATEFNGWTQFADEQTDGKVELTADGLAITVGIQTGQLWQPQIMVIPDGSFDLEEDGNYKVVLTAKFPTDGTLQINMGTWSANDQSTFDIASTGDFQEVECVFEPWAGNMEGSHLLFQPGDFKGTTILKNIKVIKVGGETGIQSAKVVTKAGDNARYNLAGQKVDASYKGIVIQNGKKFIQK
ncbi:MAG: hypothetical protein IJ067_00280 [Prevotella sp.]|nr:hypothetical protein [Prevotella sp.]